jgi:hypothetical protein
MKDKEVSITDQERYSITNEDKQIGKFLDSLVRNTTLSRPKTIKPSELYFGALSLIGTKKQNPDWKAQAAHSLRDIFYYVFQNSTLISPDPTIRVQNSSKIGELFKVLHFKCSI